MQYNELKLSGELTEGINGRIVLLCKEFPISGAGESPEEAFQSLLRSFRIYRETNLRGLTEANLRAVKKPVPTFTFEIPYRPEESPRETVALA